MDEENREEFVGIGFESNAKESVQEETITPPLVVHKESDASYYGDVNVDSVSSTHTESELDETTLERHRFKRKKKKSKAPFIILALLVIAAAVGAGLYFSGTVGGYKEQKTVTTTKKSYTTQVENKFEDTITVKGTYVFFEGKEVDGLEGLSKEIKYLDSGTKLIVQDENADSNFLNNEIAPLLNQYQIDYQVTVIVSSGLTSKYETTESDTMPAQTQVDTTVTGETTTIAPSTDATVSSQPQVQ